jgi:predicted RNA-binding protein YlxR (DUF448 family)
MPERSCVVCRKKKMQRELIRFVVSEDDSLRMDELRKLPGRGAYCCSELGCISDVRFAERVRASLSKGGSKRRSGRSAAGVGMPREGLGVRLFEEGIRRLESVRALGAQNVHRALSKLNEQLRRAEDPEAAARKMTTRIRL